MASLARRPYSGVLYNLETSEHVYRAGDLGSLVHNTCVTRISKIADDWAVKGFHVHVKGVEIGIRPGQTGLVFDKVFSSTKDTHFSAALKILTEEIAKKPALRDKMLREAERARGYLQGIGSANAATKAEEMTQIMEALNRSGG